MPSRRPVLQWTDPADYQQILNGWLMLGFLRRRNPIMIAEMNAEHYSPCAEIHSHSFSRGWSDGTLAEMLSAKGMSGLVATRKSGLGNQVVAFLIYRTVARESEIITVATNPQERRSGAGRALLEEMIRRCLTDRLEEIFLEVDEANMPAIRLYRSFGFADVGKRKAYYSAQAQAETSHDSGSELANQAASNHDAIIMKLDLRD